MAHMAEQFKTQHVNRESESLARIFVFVYIVFAFNSHWGGTLQELEYWIEGLNRDGHRLEYTAW
jgi:hypothetical protein